jgi:glutamine synthetase
MERKDLTSYADLEELNLEAKAKQLAHKPQDELREHYLRALQEEKSVKAVTIAFTDLEGRFHTIDYDKKFFLKSYDNLTFDGSSVRGFSQVKESDLRLVPDWASFRWLVPDVFGPGKVMIFALINDTASKVYGADFRGLLRSWTDEMYAKDKTVLSVAVELEGFLFQGLSAEQEYNSRAGFKFASLSGYYSSLPQNPLRMFIDKFAEAQRAMAFENEKDHPEVAPAQFELNYSHCDAIASADQVQLYKLMARQIAANMGMTACFLPKPVADINGNGMHTNMSLAKNGKNLFYAKDGQDGLSEFGWSFVDRILNNANDLCLILNPSVNAYRRLDPHYEAPNQIKSSAIDRTSMVRIPLANEKSARVEVRSVAPDVNPYLTFYSLFKTGLEGPITEALDSETRRTRTRFLPSNVYDAIRHFKGSEYLTKLLGEDVQSKFVDLKQMSADRCPRLLGSMVKTEEILFHHEVTNQYIWGRF